MVHLQGLHLASVVYYGIAYYVGASSIRIRMLEAAGKRVPTVESAPNSVGALIGASANHPNNKNEVLTIVTEATNVPRAFFERYQKQLKTFFI